MTSRAVPRRWRGARTCWKHGSRRLDGGEGDYFRSFYVLVDETPEFSELYQNTCTIVGKCQTRPYHMSLMYTDKVSDSGKVAIRDSLYARGGEKHLGGTVRLTKLLVCFTTGLPPEQWTCPREIELK